MALTLQLSKGLQKPPRPQSPSHSIGHGLIIHAGPILPAEPLLKGADPYAFWDGRELVSNLPGAGLIRTFGGITLQFYAGLWHEAPPLPSPTESNATVLQVPSYRIDSAAYYDGPVLGYFACGSRANEKLPLFALPLGSYRYDGPFAPAVDTPVTDSPLAEVTSARLLRAPLTQAVAVWLRARYPAGPHPLVQVTLDPSGDLAAQALALVYLKMSEYCAAIAVDSLEDLPKAKAQGFKALARNLGAYVGKAKPPARLRAEAVTLHLPDLAALCTHPCHTAACIADFNRVSALFPRDLLPDLLPVQHP